ncbi:PREDICTED: E3 ubiquitin-protein ligase RNF14-like [Branchiostoma belcheri]|uniref:RBR-type E3 ubiquitin transferase n=1 Tax=Branchiostoma belcheri TaxID=7741 RepID=A0A6P5AH45_BRABE|nr:PREDICTED: E3 ubiquitin-protein ligase RNF14-like [Branchiostoma belcheri]
MAEGLGEPGSAVVVDDGSISMEKEQAQANFDEQNDEILALESILEQNFTLRSRHQEEDEDSRFAFAVAVPVDLPKGQLEVQLWLPGDSDVREAEAAAVCSSASTSRPEFNRSMSGRRWHASFNVSHLPPVTLDVTLPLTYPSHAPPCFVISCLWLDGTKLSTLCKQLDALWEESKGLPIIYTWVDWLQSSTIQFLGLDDYIILMPVSMRFGVGTTPDHEEGDNFQSDPRVSSEQADPVQSLQEILRVNYAKEFETFQRNTQECGICFDSKLGAEFFLMSECRHFFCHECVAGYCQIHVKDGTVQQISCPDEGCDGSLPPGVIRQVLGDEEYERWESLLLQKTLDTMDDVVWCPRCNNVVIRDSDQDSKLAQCGSCLFCFCTSCGDAWHQSRECKSVEEKLKDLTEQLLGDKAGEIGEGTEEEILAAAKNVRDPKVLMNKAQLISRLRAERLSKVTITKTTKRCPNCKTNIEKEAGCNKMTCAQCGTYFCWLCLKKIDGYDHFGSKCTLFQPYIPPVFYRVPEREVPEGMRRLQEALERDPEAIHRVKNCPNCRQRNLKTGTNNHIKCWSCRANICYQCLTKITGPVTSHFVPPNPCKQHS